MSVYLDASVVGSLIFRDSNHERARLFYASLSQPPRMSLWTEAEVTSAAMRLLRVKQIGQSDLSIAFDEFTMVWKSSVIVAVENIDIAMATTLLRTSPSALRAPDALHIAICQRLGLDLKTFDEAMACAAKAAGVALSAS